MSVKTAAPTAAATSLGLFGLIGIIISAMVGGGIFSLPHDMAATAAPGAILIAWAITGVGMWFIVNTFRILADVKPNLTSGLYTYAEAGFGRFMGFLVAWGYWLSNCFAIVAYAVLAMSTVGAFLPGFDGGNTVTAIVVGSVVIWAIFVITLVGPRRTSLINLVATIGKLIPILMFIVLVVTVFKAGVFVHDFWGSAAAGGGFDLGAVMGQVKPTMLVTLWVFIGIEGAVVVSRRALSQTMVRQATLIGFLVTLALYILVSALPLGLVSREHLADMANPSMATILLEQFGSWGSTIVSVGVIISVLASWLVWMMLLGEMPAAAARNGTFPTVFARENRRGTPWVSLLAAAAVIQVAFVLTYFAEDAWSLMYSICSVMAMPCYLITTLFLIKLSQSDAFSGEGGHSRRGTLVVGLLGSIYGVWLIYAAGLPLMMAACLVYAVSTPLYVVARRQNQPGQPVFARYEWIVFAVVTVLGLIGLGYLIWG